MGAVQILSEFFSGLSYDDLPSDVVEAAKLSVLDTVGCLLAGSREATPKTLARVVSPGREPWRATALPAGAATSTAEAALVNGTAAGVLELDDTHKRAGAHPGVATVPSALAVGETVGANGRRVLLSVAVGYEAGARIGEPLQPGVFDRGIHIPAVGGSFSAAAAASALLGLDAARTTAAFAICSLTPVAPLSTCSAGGTAKDLYGGWPNFVGTLAAILASEGVTGSEDSIRGNQGLWRVLGGTPDEGSIVRHLGETWAVLTPCRKPHACCRLTHAPVDAVASLKRRLGPGSGPRPGAGLEPGNIRQIVVRTQSIAFKLNRGEARDPVSARFSIPYTVALALLVGRDLTVDDFTPEVLANPVLRDLMGKVKVEHDPGLDADFAEPPAGRGARTAIVEVTLGDGTTASERVDFPKGDPANPMSPAEIMAKFRALASRTLPQSQVEDALELIVGMDRLDSVARLTDLLRSAARS